MTHRELRFPNVTGIVLAAVLASLARAQNPADPPASVHLARIKGSASVQHGENATWWHGSLDHPLSDGDHVVIGAKGQADIVVDEAHAFRAAGNTEVRIAEVLPGRFRLALLKGSIVWQVTAPSAALVEIETPSVSVRPSHRGDYSIVVNRAGESEIVSRTGAVEVQAPTGSEWVNTGQKMVARGPAANPEFRIGPAVPRWRRIALAAMSYIQIAGTIAGSISSSDDRQAPPPTSASSGEASAPTAPTPPPRERTPAASPRQESGRGKG